MREQILEDLKQAMKEQNKELVKIIRMVKGEIQLLEIELKHELTDAEMTSLISKQIKQRKETIKEIESSNREDYKNELLNEIEVLSRYMPKMLSVDEINEGLDRVFAKINPTSIKDMGIVMKEAKELFNGKADMSLVSSLIKEKLN